MPGFAILNAFDAVFEKNLAFAAVAVMDICLLSTVLPSRRNTFLGQVNARLPLTACACARKNGRIYWL